MSEVALVAAITGAASVLTSGVTAAVTWTVSKNSSRVEIAKISAENDRLQQANREEERRNRQSTYHQFIDILNQLFLLMGGPASEDEVLDVTETYNHLISGVVLFGPPSVRTGAFTMNDIFRELEPALKQQHEEHPERPFKERWVEVCQPRREKFAARGADLIQLMHADVTRGIAEDPGA
jgi:hypothetical protein